MVGLLGGFGGASICQCVSYIVLVKRADWNEIAQKAVERIQKEDEALDEDKDENCSTAINSNAACVQEEQQYH